ncbi:hypothetical protein R1sor_019467 [Riccia sorocarpa]|uniref:Serine/threonine-protein kinase n=1 Tax=Riccia sorocarpa TaxID=122646 RepID=A0ABD3ICL2_9MARC
MVDYGRKYNTSGKNSSNRVTNRNAPAQKLVQIQANDRTAKRNPNLSALDSPSEAEQLKAGGKHKLVLEPRNRSVERMETRHKILPKNGGGTTSGGRPIRKMANGNSAALVEGQMERAMESRRLSQSEALDLESAAKRFFYPGKSN